MQQYREKVHTIEAIQFTYGNKQKAFDWLPGSIKAAGHSKEGEPILKIQTLSSVLVAQLGDYIIKKDESDYEIMSKEDFENKYEAI